MLDKCKRVLIDAPSILDYQEVGNLESDRIALLLHGYGQNSDDIIEQMGDVLLHDYHWIIPNGVFPMPRRRSERISYKFAWYFFDSKESRYYIDFEYPATILSKFLKQINKADKDITIVGYSQGGYLSPFIAQKYEKITKVIGVNCNYRYDMLADEIHFELNSIHGTDDPIVCPTNSYNSFEKLKLRINGGSYYKIEGSSHEIDEKIREQVKSLII